MKNKYLLICLILCLLVQPFTALAKNGKNQEAKGDHKKYIIGLHKNVDAEQYVQKHNGKLKKWKKTKHTHALIVELASEDIESLKDSEEVRFIEEDAVVQTTEQSESIAIDEENKEDNSDPTTAPENPEDDNSSDLNPSPEAPEDGNSSDPNPTPEPPQDGNPPDSVTEPTPEPTEEDGEQTYPQGIRDIGAVHAGEEKITGKNVKIAVLDTGISEHPDLEIAGGISFVEGVESYEDDNGHGTHVAGTIAALDNDLGVVGVAPKADLYAVKVLDEDGSGTYSSIIEGIEWAIDNKMDIISMSLGGSSNSQALHESIKRATDEGILVIASAGNEGEDGMLYPARFPEVLSVGAVDEEYERARFSSVGEELDLVAPGVGILSTSNDGAYEERSGTSMAAPHVTGAAALLWSDEKKWDSEKIKEELKRTATPLGPSEEYGSGFVNVAYALGLVDGPIIEVKNQPLPNPAPDTPLLSIQQFDQKLLAYMNELESLIQMAVKDKDFEMAKRLNEEKAKLLTENLELHKKFQLGSEKKDKENSVSMIEEQMEREYQNHEAELQDLLEEYESVIQSARDRYAPFGNDRGIDREAEIKAADTYEPNDYTTEATPTQVGNSLSSYISVSGDIDVYSFVAPKSTPMTVSLDVPSDLDYDLYIFDQNEEVVATSANGTGAREIATFQATASSLYYAVVFGFTDTYSADEPYQLRIADDELYLFRPYDVSLPSGVEQIFRITPASDGMYRIFTGPYGGFGTGNDTVLELYADENVTDLIAVNDDAAGTTFSEIYYEFEAGTTYYLKLRAFTGNVHARVQVQLHPQYYPELMENTPVDVTLEGPSKMVYRFTPSASGTIRFFTSPYAGGQEVVDTVLELYADENLTNQIGSNDDFGGTLFSEIQVEGSAGQTIYVALWAYRDDTSYVRLQANTSSSSAPAITISSPVIPESSTNDGSITATQVVSLVNGTFAADVSTGVIVQPLPSGISVQVTRISDTQLAISFVGQALNHGSTDDILNATVTIEPFNVIGATTSLTSNPFSFDFVDTASAGSSVRYIYNKRNQLVQIYENGVLTMEITYDDNGNVLRKTRVR